MNDKPQQKAAPEGAAKSTATKPEPSLAKPKAKPKPTSQTPSGTGGGGALWAGILALAALALGGYLWQQQQQGAQPLAALEAQQAQLAEQLAQQRQQQQQAMEQWSEQQRQRLARLSAAQDAPMARIERLEQQLRLIQAHLPSQLREWELAEVDYLLRLAEHRLRLERAPHGALLALAQAEQALAQMDDPRLAPLHEALRADIATLQAVPEFDRQALHRRIDGLVTQVTELGHRPQGRPVGLNAEPALPSESPNGGLWQRFWQQLKQDLGKLVVIRHQDDPAEFSGLVQQQHQRLLLVQHLELLRHPLERGDHQGWQQGIERARQTLADHFDPSGAAWQQVEAALVNLGATPLHSELPSVGDTITLLEQLLLTLSLPTEVETVPLPSEPSTSEAAAGENAP